MESTSLLRIKSIDVFQSRSILIRFRRFKVRVNEQSYFIYAKPYMPFSSFSEGAQRIVWNSAILA